MEVSAEVSRSLTNSRLLISGGTSFFTQKILQRDQIYRFAVIIKLYDRIKNNAVLMLIEIVSAYDLGGFDNGF